MCKFTFKTLFKKLSRWSAAGYYLNLEFSYIKKDIEADLEVLKGL